MMMRGSATGLNINPDAGNLQLCYHWGDASSSWGYRPNAYVVNNEWTFAAVTIEPTKATFYVNGVQAAVNTAAHASVTWNAPIFLGGDGSGSQDPRRMTDGMLDDVSLFSRALTADEIKVIMKGLVDPASAVAPSPADTATDVPQDVSLSWKAGEARTAHDIYLGKSAADVNSASGANPKGVLASAGPDGHRLRPGRSPRLRPDLLLAGRRGQRCPDNTIFKGNVWSFTVEPYAYPITGVTATASSAQPGMGPENTVNGSGLNADGPALRRVDARCG